MGRAAGSTSIVGERAPYFWAGCAAISAGVLLHLPMLAMAHSMGNHLNGMPMDASMGLGMALIGIGIDSFSITPAAVGPVKAMVRSIDAAAVRTKVEALLAKPPANLRKSLGDWAKRHGVSIG